MPVSIEKSTRFAAPARTITAAGSRRRTEERTVYGPGARRTRHEPSLRTVTRATTAPPRVNERTAPAAGAVHGSSATHVGVIGPRVTVPNRPERAVVAPAAVVAVVS